jgi:hypothetical protein
MLALNEQIASDRTNLGAGFCIGHSFFVPRDESELLNEEWYKAVLETEIFPLLEEYAYDDPSKVDSWRKQLMS